ncbi:unnamed protein product [Vicia faba]|uniref:Leucine-rich repeat-containing N-terminal plant-type domain-containing protein n=1 Tax=Vicia faba TaxID=3906 RepID=A0AAV0Z538_VICFA|nr:unnamed protein product [Vicia faba]
MVFVWSLVLSLHFLFLYSLLSFTFTSSFSLTHPNCRQYESHALLQFKEGFNINTTASYNPLSYPKTASWNASTDCCSWDGVICDDHTNYVIHIDLSSSQLFSTMDANTTLFRLVHLQHLDLSDNHFNYSQIPSEIGELSQLRYLNLSHATFFGEIPSQLSHLSNLLSLDLDFNLGTSPLGLAVNFLQLKSSSLKSIIHNSTKLESLLLDYVTISSSLIISQLEGGGTEVWSGTDWETVSRLAEGLLLGSKSIRDGLAAERGLLRGVAETIFPFGSLSQPKDLEHVTQKLQSQWYPEKEQDKLTNLTSLKALSLSNSELYGEFPVRIFHLPNLKFLDLRYNPNLIGRLPEFQSNSVLTKLALDETGFYGTLPVSIGKLSSLNILSIPSCHFIGYIPSSIDNLTQLIQINLQHNKFRGDPSSSLANLTKLTLLNVGFNEFTFETISWIGEVSSIITLDICSVNIGSDIPSSFANLTQLETLNAENCNIKGEFPSWIMNLTNLVNLYLPHNLLHGNLLLDMFWKLKELDNLNLSFNKPSLHSGKNSSHMKDSRIRVIELGSCNLLEVPMFIRYLSDMTYLGLSNNNITLLPSWLWRKSSLQILDISHNSLTGEISPFICNLKSLIHLKLWSNNLSGNVPSCIGNFSQYLEILMFKGNNLSGLIPQTYLMGNVLQMIDFSNNNVQGQLPRELVKCGWLEYFDISHNNIKDSFPFWLGDLPELKVLGLSENQFHGDIRCPDNMTCTFPKLHIIDLSHNEFSGIFPSGMIQSWKAMKTSDTSQLQYEQGEYSGKGNVSYSFTMSNKGMVLVYEKLQEFYSMIAIDMSSNKISGQIPKVIGDLKGLVLLNLSNNNLVGSIPSSLGKLLKLEALDLSFNTLSGKIPQQLTQLTFLEFFNVSLNNLTGPIPQNGQFSTFQSNSFEGNKGLCGDQLLNKCLDHAGHSYSPPSASDGEHDSESFIEIEWKVSLIGYVGGLIAGVALGTTYSSQVIRWLKRFF